MLNCILNSLFLKILRVQIFPAFPRLVTHFLQQKSSLLTLYEHSKVNQQCLINVFSYKIWKFFFHNAQKLMFWYFHSAKLLHKISPGGRQPWIRGVKDIFGYSMMSCWPFSYGYHSTCHGFTKKYELPEINGRKLIPPQLETLKYPSATFRYT